MKIARRERPAVAAVRAQQQIPLPEKRLPRKSKREGHPVVALVRAPIVSSRAAVNNEATPCLAYAYLAAYVEPHGYKCTIVDGIGEALNQVWPLEKWPNFQCHGLTFEAILERIPPDAEVIAFSGMFSGEWPVLRELVNAARARFPDALFVIGGEHVTALTEYSLRDCPAIDVAARGEGEHALYEILETYREGGDFARVNGVAYLDGEGKYVEVGALPRLREGENLGALHRCPRSAGQRTACARRIAQHRRPRSQDLARWPARIRLPPRPLSPPCIAR
jgi:hypothetical protein